MLKTGAFVVSGAGSGIGLAICAKIIANGHHVFGLGRSSKKLQAAADTFGAKAFSFAVADLSLASDVSRAVADIRRWLKAGGLPLLGVVNNAGVFERVSFVDSSDEVWIKQFENNMMSAVRLTRELHDDLRLAEVSSVLNISSTLGVRPVANTLAYSAVKAAMVNWTQGLALEWAKENIRVNCICPGVVDTPIHAFHSSASDSEAKKQAAAFHPLNRLGEVEDVAEAAWFLLNESSKWTTGAVLNVDGGISL